MLSLHTIQQQISSGVFLFLLWYGSLYLLSLSFLSLSACYEQWMVSNYLVARWSSCYKCSTWQTLLTCVCTANYILRRRRRRRGWQRLLALIVWYIRLSLMQHNLVKLASSLSNLCHSLLMPSRVHNIERKVLDVSTLEYPCQTHCIK